MDDLVIVTLLFATLRISTPLIFASMGGLFSEKSGVVNIALEGMMLIGAFSSVVAVYYTGTPWIGVLAAIVSGVFISGLHAVISVLLKGKQIISGLAINIFAAAATQFLVKVLFDVEGTSPSVAKLPQWSILGSRYSFNPLVFLSIPIVVLCWIMLFKTPFGLRIRAVGEYPKAATTVGVNVYRVRIISVIICGALAGIAGAHLSIGESSVFVSNMISGRGYIALAAIIFGNWKPFKAFLAALIFGFTEALQIFLVGIKIGGVTIPSQFIGMVPYIITIIVVAVFIKKSKAPSASGLPYEK